MSRLPHHGEAAAGPRPVSPAIESGELLHFANIPKPTSAKDAQAAHRQTNANRDLVDSLRDRYGTESVVAEQALDHEGQPLPTNTKIGIFITTAAWEAVHGTL